MAFDVAMNEWLTVMTSSPGPTPSAASATCRAVVQLDTAQACEVRTASANSRSNAATSGPCVTHPERMERRAASASASPRNGLAIGIIESDMTGHGFVLLRAPPGDEKPQAFLEIDGCAETDG